MLWDSDLPIQEYSDTHVYTTIYDQGSFKPVARLAWLRDDIPRPANDEPIFDDSYPQVEVKPKSKIEVYHYHNDQLGTPNELTNQQGEVVWLADYEAWGNTARVVWNENQLEQLQVSQDELQPIRFQGQYYDEETGLHYNRFRYYDLDMGMFTTRDPIGLMGGDNVFAYAPNPIRWVDPLGLKVIVQRPPGPTVTHKQPVLRTTQSPSRGYDKENVAEVNRGMNVLKCGGLFTAPCSVLQVCTKYKCPGDSPDNQCTALPKPSRLISAGKTHEDVGCICLEHKVIKEEDAP